MIELISFILGASIGSFSKCQADRYGKNDNNKRSHCTACGKTLGIAELIPIISFIILKGRCKKCKSRIGIGSLIVEIVSAIVFLVIYLRFGISIECVIGFIFYTLLIIPSLIDIRLMIIPNIFPMLVLGMSICIKSLSVLCGTSNISSLMDSVLGGVLVPGLILLLSFALNKITKKETLGMGDIKILVGIGFLLGLELSLINILLMSLIGIFVSLIMRIKKGEPFPLMPSICASSIITYLFGNGLIEIYKIFLGEI